MMKQGARLKKHAPEKSVWILVVTCQFSRAVFLDALESYSTASLIIGLQKLEATYRRLSKIISDASTQWWEPNMLEKHYANSTVFKWKVVPTAAHHFIRGAEKMVGMMKKLLKRKLDGAAISHNELLLFLLEVAKMLNTRPLVAETSEDGERWRMIAPIDLLGGRDTEPLYSYVEEKGNPLKVRLRYLGKLTNEFWCAYLTEMLLNLLRSNTWNKESNDVVAKDVVLVESKSLVDRAYRMGRVVECKDGAKNTTVKFQLQPTSKLEDHKVSTRQLRKIPGLRLG
ncbi:MAG: hypothetical protein GY696_01990 [Gammaproteobacteria bacterium]|nr:hypothetical protein [Gammaproteobacteria bacterium]